MRGSAKNAEDTKGPGDRSRWNLPQSEQPVIQIVGIVTLIKKFEQEFCFRVSQGAEPLPRTIVPIEYDRLLGGPFVNGSCGQFGLQIHDQLRFLVLPKAVLNAVASSSVTGLGSCTV